MRVARIAFANANGTFNYVKTYDYFTDLDLSKGDKVVVDSPSKGLVVVEVVDVIESETIKVSKWVVDKVDLTAYEERLRKTARAEEVRALLEKKAKRVNELEKYSILANLDPEAATLLEELKELSK